MKWDAFGYEGEKFRPLHQEKWSFMIQESVWMLPDVGSFPDLLICTCT
jgi:hypothetical protein